MKHALFTILVLLTSHAHGQVYRLYCVGGGYACNGSGVAVSQQRDGSYVFVTAKHVVDGMERIFVDLPSGRTQATFMGVSSKYDLAAFRLRSPVRLPVYRPSPTNATSGRYAVVGYAQGGAVRSTPVKIQEGRFEINASVGNKSWFIPIQIRTSARGIQGESGGAVVSTDGKLVGVLSSTDGSSGYASGYTAMCEMFGSFGWNVCPPNLPNYGRPTTPIPPGYQSEEPPYVPGEQPVPQPTPEPRIEYRQGPRGEKGERGPPGESWDRQVVRGWIDEKVQERVSSLEGRLRYDDSELRQQITDLKNRPGYNDSELRQRLTELENRPGYDDLELRQRVESLESRQTVILPSEAKAEPRKITIYVQEIGPDGKPTGRMVATPVEVPPTENEITIPIKRFSSGN